MAGIFNFQLPDDMTGLGTLMSGAANMIGSIGSIASAHNNHKLQLDNYALNKANVEWQQKQYLENRDYEHALQQTIFDREDTAYQRAVEDATSAGFSPLAALGNLSNAGSVVSSSQAPAGQLTAPQDALSPAFQHLAQSGTAFGAQLMSIAENANQRAFEAQMFKNQVMAATADREDAQLHEWLLQDDQQRALEERDFAQHTYRLLEVERTAYFQEALQKAQHVAQAKMQQSDQKHQMDMQNDQQQHQMDLQKQAQDYESDYRVKTFSATWEDNWDIAEKYLVPAVRKFSPELADWIEENQFGKDILVQMLATMESGLPLIQQGSDLVESIKQNANPLSQLFPSITKPKKKR